MTRTLGEAGILRSAGETMVVGRDSLEPRVAVREFHVANAKEKV